VGVENASALIRFTFDSDHGASKICIFTAVGAIEHGRILGIGNAALRVGDHLVTYEGQKPSNDGLRTHEFPCCSALILRPATYAPEYSYDHPSLVLIDS
jgi:hypothetical protein